MRKNISVITLLTCMLIIFLLSSQPAPASAGLSRQLTTAGVSVGEKLGFVAQGTTLDTKKISRLDNRVRQYAHSFAFFVLALALGFVFKHMDFGPFKGLLLSLLLAALLAGLDEWHQTFVPGRGMEWRDFKSDMQGVVLGLLFVGLSYLKVRRTEDKVVE